MKAKHGFRSHWMVMYERISRSIRLSCVLIYPPTPSVPVCRTPFRLLVRGSSLVFSVLIHGTKPLAVCRFIALLCLNLKFTQLCYQSEYNKCELGPSYLNFDHAYTCSLLIRPASTRDVLGNTAGLEFQATAPVV